jgi:tetratricopeptide (TPR) repeat protein
VAEVDPVRRWTPRAVAMAGFAAYALVAPAGLYWLDSGELGAAVWQIGSPHPTGFPLYVALARLVALVPVGELAFRLHLASAAAAAVALGLVAALVAEVGGNRRAASVAGAGAAALLAVSLTFARQASVTEVYALTAALLAAGLYLYDRVARGADARHGLALALVAGLGIGAHGSFRLLFALPLIVLLFVRLRRGARWPLLAPVVAIAAAAAIHLALPVRATTGRTAAVDWGHPRSAPALVDHVDAVEIRASWGDRMLSREPLVLRDSAGRFFAGAGEELGALAALAALLGAIHLARDRRSRWLLFALASVLVGDAFYAIWLNPMGIADRQVGVPFALAVALLAGAGLVWLGRFAGRAGPFAAAAAAAVLVVGPAMATWADIGPVGEAPRRFAEAALDGAPPRAVLLTRSDSLSAGVLFLQVAEGARPDLAALVRQRLADRERTAAVLGAPATLAEILAGARPVLWEPGDDPLPTGHRLRAGPVAALLDRDVAGDIERAAAEVASIFAGAEDPVGRRTQAQALTALGRLAYQRGDVAGALRLFDRALAASRDHAEALVNRGVALSRLGRLAEAAEVTERALSSEPNRVRALLNAARYRLALGQKDRALGHLRRVVALDPTNPEAASALRALDQRVTR